jgi:hypothetical protein
MIYKKKKSFTLGRLTLSASRVELSHVRSKTHNIVRRSVFGGLALIMVITNMVFLTYFLPEPVRAATEGPFFAGTGANNNDGGTTVWTNPGNASGDTTGTAATVSPPSNGSTSQQLRLTNFGFNIPSGSEINGVNVEVEQQAANASRHRWNNVRLLIGGAESGTNLSDASAIPTAKGFKTFGSSSNLWGLTPSITDINATDFGVSLKIDRNSNQATTTSIFRIRITITYTIVAAFEQSAYQWFDNLDAPTTTWAQTWGGSGSDIARALVQTSDGGYAVAGSTGSTGLTAGSNDQTLVKYNSSGVEQWSKTWGGTGSDVATALVQTSDGGYAVAGYTDSTGLTAGLEDQTLVKYDSSGVEQWSKTWGGTGTDAAYALVQTSDGGYAVAGQTDSTGLTAGLADQTLVKYDSSGIEQWSKTWGGTGYEYAYALVQTSDGGYAVAGRTASTGLTAGGDDQTLVKYDSSGVEQWSKTWGGTGNDIAYALVQTSDGGYAVAGYTASSGLTAGGFDQTLVKYNSSGIEQWSKTWGGNSDDYARALIETSDGGYAVAGYTNSTGLTAGSWDQTLVKYDSSGVEQWSKTWGGDGSDFALALVQTSDGGFAVAGQTASTGLTAGSDDQTFLKFASNGTIADCPACVDRAVAEVDRAVTEVDRTTAEVDRATSEVDRAVTEVNRDSPQTLVHCGVIGGYLHSWGGNGVDIARALVQTSDGGYAVAGSTGSTGLTAGSDDQTLVKYDSSGIEQWSKTWGGDLFDVANALVQTSDGGYAVAGSTNSTGLTAGSYDQTLVKYDSSGIEQWSKTWGGTGDEYANALVQTSDGGYAVAGYTNSTGLTAGSYDQTLVKYDSSGIEQWSKTWGGTGDEYARALVQTSDGGYAVAGYTDSTGLTAGLADQTLVKYDSSGIEQWSKTWGGTGYEYAYALVHTSDGGYAVAGQTDSTGLTAGGYDQTLVKYDSSGIEQWSKTWGGTGDDRAYALVQTSDGGYAVAGFTDSPGLTAGGYDQTLVKYDSSGIEQWSKTWGGTGADFAYALVQTSDGGYAVAGQTNSPGLTAGGIDQTLIKIDSSGTCSGVCTDRTTAEVNRVTSEVNRATSEVNRATSEVDRATAEVDRAVTEVARNETLTTGILIDVGDQLNGVSQNTATFAPAEGTPFRLRANLHVSVIDATAGDFKLQFAERVGTCDTSFTGETYADVTASSTIAYYLDNNAADGASLASNVNDPTHGPDNIILQEYSVNGNFSVVNTIPQNNDGLWDFALVDNGAPAYTSYCFRIVNSGGGVLSTYTVVPELIIGDPSFEQSAYRWYENQDADTSVGTWAQTWGGDLSDEAYALVQTSDGGYAVAGRTASTGLTAGGDDQTLVKYDSSGVEQWSKTWGGTGNDIAYALVQTSDGGYAVAGYTASTGLTAGSWDQTLVKYDSSGIEQWSKTWGGTGGDYAIALVQTSDGGYAVAGYTDSTGLTAGGFDQTLVKYDSSGIEQWSKTWGGTGNDFASALVQTSDGGYAVAGSTNSTGLTAGGIDQTLVKYDSSGVEQWSKTWGGDLSDIANALVQTSDGGYAVAGYTASAGLTAGSNDQTLVKYNSSGIEQWSKTWGGTGDDRAYALVQTSDGGFAVAGYTNSPGLTAGGNDQTLVKYDSSGVEQWSKTWGGTNTDIARALVQTSDGGYAVAGQTASTGLTAGSFDQTLLKFASDGTIADCPACVDRATAEVDRATAEVDRATAEVDRATTEVDRAVTEVNRDSPQTLVHCGVIGGYLHSWGGTGTDAARALVQTSDGGYAVAGYTASTGLTAGGNDQTLVKYDSSGIEQWSKTWGGTGNDYANALVQTSDGGYAVAGSTDSTGLTAGGNDQTLVKYDSSGVEQWSKTWGGDLSDIAYALIQTSDGGYAVAGSTNSTGLTAGGNDQTLVKYDSSGVEQWSKTWGGDLSDIAYALIQTSDGGYAVAGSTASTGLTAGSNDQTLVKYNSSGVEQWSKTWGGTGVDEALALVQTTDGGFAVAGYTGSTGLTAGLRDQTLVKYNSSGIEQWSKTWGGNSDDYARALIETTDGGFAVAGSHRRAPV